MSRKTPWEKFVMRKPRGKDPRPVSSMILRWRKLRKNAEIEANILRKNTETHHDMLVNQKNCTTSLKTAESANSIQNSCKDSSNPLDPWEFFK